MAHDADFHGDTLRLRAFLRVKVPGRPKRLRPNMQAPSSPANKHGPASELDIVFAKPPIAAGTANRPSPELELTFTEPSSVRTRNPSRSGSTSNLTDSADTYGEIDLEVVQPDINSAEALSAAERKSKIVYTAKKRQRKQPMGILNAREKHLLPDNGLALVRASTDHDLPFSGVRTAFGSLQRFPDMANSVATGGRGRADRLDRGN